MSVFHILQDLNINNYNKIVFRAIMYVLGLGILPHPCYKTRACLTLGKWDTKLKSSESQIFINHNVKVLTV